MKKLICLILLVAALACMLSACGLICGLCGKILPGKTYKAYNPNLMTAVEIDVCEDCYQDMGYDIAE